MEESLRWFLSQGRWAEIAIIAVLALVGLVLVKMLVSVAWRVVVLVVCLGAMGTGLYYLQGVREKRSRIRFKVVSRARVISASDKAFSKGMDCTVEISGSYLRPKDLKLNDSQWKRAYVSAVCRAAIRCPQKPVVRFEDDNAECLFMLGRGYAKYQCDPCNNGKSLRVLPAQRKAFFSHRLPKEARSGRIVFRLKHEKLAPFRRPPHDKKKKRKKH